MAATQRCEPSEAKWYAEAIIGNDRLGETTDVGDYFTGDKPTRADLWTPADQKEMRADGWKVLEFTVKKCGGK